MELTLADFKQPSWGQQISGGLTETTGLSFGPAAQFNDEPFDLWVHDVELVAK